MALAGTSVRAENGVIVEFGVSSQLRHGILAGGIQAWLEGSRLGVCVHTLCGIGV